METFSKHLASPNDFITLHNKNKHNFEKVIVNSILSPSRFKSSNISNNFNKFDP